MSQKGKFLAFSKEETGYQFGKNEFIGVLIAIGLFIFFSVVPFAGLSHAGQLTLAILILTLALWMNPGIPQTMTTFLMIVLALSFGVMKLPEVFSGFGASPFLMVFALLIVAMGMSTTQLARRLAYYFIVKLGTSPSMLLLALVTTTSLISSMIADIPTLIVCMAITAEILKEMGEEPGKSRLGKAMMFGISFASITGGLAFISGSGINPVGIAVLEQVTKGQMTITFTQWAAIGVPFAFLMNFVIWWILKTMYKLKKADAVCHQLDVELFREKQKNLGSLTYAEIRYLLTLLIMMVLFLTSSMTHFAVPYVAFIAMVLVIMPGWGSVRWKEAQKNLPWDMLFLIGLGTAFAGAISSTGLGNWMINSALGWTIEYPVIFIMLVASVVGVLVHYVMTVSSATVAVLTAAVIPLAIASGMNPAMLVIPVVFTGSATLIQPLAPDMQLTYPYGYWKIQEMFIPGLIIAAFWATLVTILTYIIAPMVGLM